MDYFVGQNRLKISCMKPKGKNRNFSKQKLQTFSCWKKRSFSMIHRSHSLQNFLQILACFQERALYLSRVLHGEVAWQLTREKLRQHASDCYVNKTMVTSDIRIFSSNFAKEWDYVSTFSSIFIPRGLLIFQFSRSCLI